jgi:hypothetical protein
LIADAVSKAVAASTENIKGSITIYIWQTFSLFHFQNILTFLYPLLFTKRKVLHNDLKRDVINEFGIKFWTSNPEWVKFQEHGSSFYMNIDEKVWLLV